jgi:hypothetical protein
MKKWLSVHSIVAALVVGSIWSGANRAQAFPQFKTEFDAKYMKAGTPIFNALEGKSNCNVCHAGKASKKNRNAYGLALSQYVTKDDKMNKEKIQSALAAVEKMPSVPGQTNAPTFGQLIAEGKLPVTTAEPK